MKRMYGFVDSTTTPRLRAIDGGIVGSWIGRGSHGFPVL